MYKKVKVGKLAWVQTTPACPFLPKGAPICSCLTRLNAQRSYCHPQLPRAPSAKAQRQLATVLGGGLTPVTPRLPASAVRSVTSYF